MTKKQLDAGRLHEWRPGASVIELIPVGEATELEPLAMIESSSRHAWDAWDVATITMDLEP